MQRHLNPVQSGNLRVIFCIPNGLTKLVRHCMALAILCVVSVYSAEVQATSYYPGTSGSDDVLVNMEFGTIRINGVVHAIDDPDVVFQGNGGQDSIRYFGSPTAFERAYVRPGSFDVVSDSFSFAGESCEIIQVNGNSNDVAFMYDDPLGVDVLDIRPGVTTLFSGTFDNEVRGFLRANVIADYGNVLDIAYVESRAFKRLVADGDSFSLIRTATAMNHYVTGFEIVETKDVNELVFYDTPGDDFVSVRKSRVKWAVADFELTHTGLAKRVIVLGSPRSAAEQDADTARVIINRTSESCAGYDFVTRNKQYLTFVDDQMFVLVTQFEEIDCELFGAQDFPSYANITTSAQHTILNVDASDRFVRFVSPQAAGGWPFTTESVSLMGFETVSAATEGDRAYLGVSIADSPGDDEVQVTQNQNRRLDGTFVSDTFRMNAHQCNEFSVYAIKGGFDRIDGSVQRPLAASPESVVLNGFSDGYFSGTSEWIGFEKNCFTNTSGGRSILRINALSGDNLISNTITATEVSADEVNVTDEIGSEMTFLDFGGVVVSGTNSVFSPELKKDIGFGPDRMRITFDNQGDSTFSQIRNTSNYPNQLGWQFQTDSFSLFVPRFENAGSARPTIEIQGVSTVGLINVPEEFPIETKRLPTIRLPVILGDVNLDGVVGFLDIQPFIGVLAAAGFQAEADIDQNGVVNFLDIVPFVALLSGS